ncbi:MARCKS-like protein [Paraburkholderia diazotrophica]|uniref:Uncharacterized protein n=1 Tax=Paraburkholderia diazotrophica TaxID=667676 RepID=A0A1H6WNK6_9BURK|nr:MARCKS-like protein [Paraburkholderia diazotrophica]SEJ18629.1 hypothetical protein SAMN05192539_1007196 [Paraburkholderia diazotrophica]
MTARQSNNEEHVEQQPVPGHTEHVPISPDEQRNPQRGPSESATTTAKPDTKPATPPGTQSDRDRQRSND